MAVVTPTEEDERNCPIDQEAPKQNEEGLSQSLKRRH